MSVLARAAGVLRRGDFGAAVRRAAIRRGWLAPPPFRYPFWETMALYPRYRPHYRWGLLCAASMAQALGYRRISAIEFGVAAGNGLLAMEQLADYASERSGVAIDVYGFDTGTGLTEPMDYRDLPQLWSRGDYEMDVTGLKQRLRRAQLMLGNVKETVPKFVAGRPAPIGFIAFDLDLYSSTMDAFRVLEASDELLLPRVNCYFDDIVGFSHGDLNGERLAISDFNKAHAHRKISRIYGLRYVVDQDAGWTEMMYLMHAVQHPRYCDFDGSNPLRASR